MVNININLRGEVTEKQADSVKLEIEAAAKKLGLSGNMQIEYEVE